MAEKKLNLLADFPPVSTQEWLDKIIADLKGADFEKKMIWRTNEGFNVRPFYREEDVDDLKITELLPGAFPYVRGTKSDNEWFVRQDIKVENAQEANAKALYILNRGVNSIGFQLKKADLSKEFVATLLKDIAADCVELNFTICISKAAELADILSEYFIAQNYDVKKLQGSINFDPINRMLLAGKKLTKEEIAEKAKAVVQAISR
ncbi:MAG TPA: methylmalonyl-CoA mutase family protein, partial [Paludibacteraceae bacterium]|nr:methylmalonyl-CoA mutase family protein [Paludibacteraceae bacterium]